MRSNATPPSAGERRLSIFILGLLALIVAVVAVMQANYDPSRWRQQAHTSTSQRNVNQPHASGLPDGLQPMSAAEQYNADTLSDKINGKADLYLSAGFQSLETQRISMTDAADGWMERFVYHMGATRNAFAVYSAQRRQPSQPLEGMDHGYLSANGLFFIHGPYYIEIIAAQAGEAIQSRMKALAAHFAKTHGPGEGAIVELKLFPPNGMVAHSKVLIADSAFGIQGLNWVFTADYQRDAHMATAFIALYPSSQQAQSQAEAFGDFWMQYDGESVASPNDLADARIVLILDNYEIALAQGPYLIGVHEATRLDFGVDIVTRLMQAVKEQSP